MRDALDLAIALGRRRRKPSSLANFRLAVSDAAALKRKGQHGAAARVLDKARNDVLDALFRRHGVGRVLKHAHQVAAAMNGLIRREVDGDAA